MYFDGEQFTRTIGDYFKGFYGEILGEIFSPATSLLGIIRLGLSPILATLWVSAVTLTFTLIGGTVLLPILFVSCIRLGRR